MSLVQNGDAAAAKLLLEGHLKEAPSDYKAISLLGKVLNYKGKNTEAMRKLRLGLEGQTTEDGKINLLLMIAIIELQLGEDGPYREQARGGNWTKTRVWQPIKRPGKRVNAGGERTNESVRSRYFAAC